MKPREVMMSILFAPLKIRNMELRNRFVRSATGDALADETGFVSDKQIALFSQLAEGGVGLIVTGLTYVHNRGRISMKLNSLAGDEYIPGFKKLTAAVHHRGAKIAVQVFHGGREAARYLNPRNEEAIAPSWAEGDPYFKGNYRSMTEAEVWDVIRAFGDAARRARESGFDAVQVHGAHAYLLSQFLSPITNRRKDAWGGDLETRLRFHREVYLDIRKKVGEDYPILIKLGVEDGFRGGLAFDDGLKAARRLAQLGFDALEISQGLRGKFYEETEFRTKIDSLEREGYFRHWCREVKRQVSVPVMMVGGLRTFELMEEVIRKGEADFISLCRPLIREPGIINEWEKGNHRRPTCVSCNRCQETLRKEEGVHCVLKADEEALSPAG